MNSQQQLQSNARLDSIMKIKLELGDESIDIGYKTLNECLSDVGLKALFNDGLVTKCSVYCGDKRITGLPMIGWDWLKERVVANSTTILHNVDLAAA